MQHCTRVQCLVFLIVMNLLVVLIIIGLHFTYSRLRARAASAQRVRNLTFVYNAIWYYARDHGRFLPRVLLTEGGEPQHSWRTLLTPYLGDNIHFQIDFSERWDSLCNRFFWAIPQEYYRSPLETSGPEVTSYFALLTPNSSWGRTTEEIDKGLGPRLQEIILIEIPGLGTCWMEPRDLTIEEVLDILDARCTTRQHPYPQEVTYLTRDGVKRIDTTKFDRAALRDVLLGLKPAPFELVNAGRGVVPRGRRRRARWWILGLKFLFVFGG